MRTKPPPTRRDDASIPMDDVDHFVFVLRPAGQGRSDAGQGGAGQVAGKIAVRDCTCSGSARVRSEPALFSFLFSPLHPVYNLS